MSDLRDGLDSVGDGGHLVPDHPHPGARPGHQQAGLQGRQEADHEVSQLYSVFVLQPLNKERELEPGARGRHHDKSEKVI